MNEKFWNGFSKFAIDMATLRKATSNIPGHIRAHQYIKPEAFKALSKSINTHDGKVKDFNRSIGIVSKTKKSIGPRFDVSRGKIFAKGDPLKHIPIKSNPKMNSEQREFFNRVALNHERDEGIFARKNKIKKKIDRGATNTDMLRESFQGHHSPEVILREGNLLSSAPEHLSAPSKAIFGEMRGNDHTIPAIKTVMPQYEHGKTRLSRHAIKHISNSLKKKNQEAIDKAYAAIKHRPTPRQKFVEKEVSKLPQDFEKKFKADEKATMKKRANLMNDNFWSGFEKQASEKTAFGFLTRMAVPAMQAMKGFGNRAANWGTKALANKASGGLMKTVGMATQQGGKWMAANPGKAALGAGALGVYGANKLLGGQPNVNVTNRAYYG